MVLLIDGHVQSDDGTTDQTFIQTLYSNQAVISKAQCFKSLPTVHIDGGSSVLYVCQGEMAIIPSADITHRRDLPRILGSDDATSCCIVVLSSPSHHIIAHLDSSERVKSFFAQMSKLNKMSSPTPIKLHIVGGFQDKGGIAEEILTEFFNKVAFKSSEVYELGVCCVGELNLRSTDNKVPAGPAVLGISYDCALGSLKPSTIGWSARNPLAILRLSRLYRNDDTQSITNIFDYERCRLTLTPFSYLPYCLARSPIITYEQLRSHSTTPDHEPPSFFEGSAAVNRLMFYYPDPLKTWFKNGPLEFVFVSSVNDSKTNSEYQGAWTPADEQCALVSDNPIFSLPLPKY